MEPLQIGVCSWSLAMPDLLRTLSSIRTDLGLKLAQVGFMDDSYQQPEEAIATIHDSHLEISATCVAFDGEDYTRIETIARTGGLRPDDAWPARRDKTIAVADITRQLGVPYLAMHIGFVPHDRNDPLFAVMSDRVRTICDALGERDIELIMETGQEPVETLLEFISHINRPNLGVNFDPANMILYGVGDPVDAVIALKDQIRHVHMKDANPSNQPGTEWGEEVVLGTGEAQIPRIVSKLRAQGYAGPLVIEREAGSQRHADIREGISFLESLVG